MTQTDYAASRTVDFDEIPVVDVSDLDTVVGRARISADIMAAAQTSGFFYISGHGIHQDLIDRAFAASRDFFALPADDKATVQVNMDQRGWMGQGMTHLEGAKTHDAKEVFFWGWDVDADDNDVKAGVPMVAVNQWPDAVAPDLKPQLMAYYLSVVDMGRKIMGALATGLGREATFFDKAYAAPLARGQLVYYPAMTEDDRMAQRFGAAAHSDFGALTILKQDDVGGLQVQNLAGEWINAPPLPGTFVCNIGDLLERWSNGRLVSTKHRVLNSSGRSRYSVPIFFDPASQTPIDPADFGAVDPNYTVVTAGEHIAGRNGRNFKQYQKD
ncbi:2-oxoglutarate and iron-dependent oxygenase domain-containing protein [Ascidiaceihabitans sp.]|uniref:isopenicillin N synthase family dioxygenase n=1 Tax=Ascidiaceihabitans sp. TaxID=1872644 RepID=UPI003296AD72